MRLSLPQDVPGRDYEGVYGYPTVQNHKGGNQLPSRPHLRGSDKAIHVQVLQSSPPRERVGPIQRSLKVED